jgi:hypothetical protein
VKTTLAALAALLVMLAPGSVAAKAGGSAVISGSVRIEGRIEKVKLSRKKRFNPYANVYKDDKPPAELAQQLIVYLDGPVGAKPGPPKVLGQKDRQFSDSIVPILPGGEVEIRNEDTVRHHIRSNAKPWNFNLKPRAPGETVTKKFEGPQEGGLGIVPVYCDIHPEMRAHVLILPSAEYQLLPETGGRFRLEGVPPGTYTLSAWHPTLKPVPVKLTVKAGEHRTVELVMQGKKD